jgi:hypothetical protein
MQSVILLRKHCCPDAHGAGEFCAGLCCHHIGAIAPSISLPKASSYSLFCDSRYRGSLHLKSFCLAATYQVHCKQAALHVHLVCTAPNVPEPLLRLTQCTNALILFTYPNQVHSCVSYEYVALNHLGKSIGVWNCTSKGNQELQKMLR